MIIKMHTVYTCPMHPEVRQDKPGMCPECGMNLVPGKAEGPDKSRFAVANRGSSICFGKSGLVGPLGLAWHEIHPAFRTHARLILPYLRMHGTGIHGMHFDYHSIGLFFTGPPVSGWQIPQVSHKFLPLRNTVTAF